MISVTDGGEKWGERHVRIEIEEEGAAYLALVLREYEARDAGAVFIAGAIERHLWQN